MNLKQLKIAAMWTSAVLALSGCGQGFVGFSSSSSSHSQSTNEAALQVEKIESEALLVEDALAEAEAALDAVVKNGQISLPTGGPSLSLTTTSLTGLPEKLRQALDKIYDKLTLPVAKAKALIDQARNKITAILLQLDPNDPNQAKLIDRLNEMLNRLDQVEARLGEVYKLAAAKVDLLIQRVDVLIAKVDASNPIMWVLLNELKEVRQVLVDFRDKLAST